MNDRPEVLARAPDHPLARLKEAREARGLSLKDLADRLGTNRQLVYRYQEGEIRATPSAVARFAAALNVPIGFFMRPEAPPEPAAVFFRQFRSKTTPKHLRAVERQLAWVRDFIVALEQYVVLPDVTVPDFKPPSDPQQISDELIDVAATELRRAWGMSNGVVRDVIRLVEGHGCVVVPNVIESPTVDGFSIWAHNGRPIIAIGCREVSASHRRTDVAHELGHLVLHRNIDRRYLEVNPKTHGLIETQAFRFARAFLMPEGTFRRSVSPVTLDNLLLAKTHWYLSVATMMTRAKDLGMIDDATYKRFWMNRNRRGWGTSEPLDEQIPMEHPRLLATAIVTLRDAHPENLLALSEEVGLLPSDFARFCALDPKELDANHNDDPFGIYPRDDQPEPWRRRA